MKENYAKISSPPPLKIRPFQGLFSTFKASKFQAAVYTTKLFPLLEHSSTGWCKRLPRSQEQLIHSRSSEQRGRESGGGISLVLIVIDSYQKRLCARGITKRNSHKSVSSAASQQFGAQPGVKEERNANPAPVTPAQPCGTLGKMELIQSLRTRVKATPTPSTGVEPATVQLRHNDSSNQRHQRHRKRLVQVNLNCASLIRGATNSASKQLQEVASQVSRHKYSRASHPSRSPNLIHPHLSQLSNAGLLCSLLKADVWL